MEHIAETLKWDEQHNPKSKGCYMSSMEVNAEYITPTQAMNILLNNDSHAPTEPKQNRLHHGSECRGYPNQMYIIGEALSGVCTCHPCEQEQEEKSISEKLVDKDLKALKDNAEDINKVALLVDEIKPKQEENWWVDVVKEKHECKEDLNGNCYE